MAAEGARGQTAREMGEVFGFPQSLRYTGEEGQQIHWEMGKLHVGQSELNRRLQTSEAESPELAAHMNSQMATARDWAAELGVPLTTTEAWGPWWHMDHPDLEWQWLADWCETCMALAPEYGFRGVTPWNYSHPCWENWKNIEWYRRLNGRFLAEATDTTK